MGRWVGRQGWWVGISVARFRCRYECWSIHKYVGKLSTHVRMPVRLRIPVRENMTPVSMRGSHYLSKSTAQGISFTDTIGACLQPHHKMLQL